MKNWSLAAIQKWLSETDFNRYQGIDLPYGLEVPGPRRNGTVGVAFQGISVIGKSIWDVGSHYGAVPNLLIDRGAGSVLGWEARPEYCQVAQIIAEIRGTDHAIRYVCANVEHMMPDEQFEIVTLFNVTHHLYYPAYTLANIASRAAEAFLIEWATLETYNNRHGRQAPPDFDEWPIFLADKYGCWYCTQSALDTVLGRCGFANIEHRASPLGTHRRITACHR